MQTTMILGLIACTTPQTHPSDTPAARSLPKADESKEWIDDAEAWCAAAAPPLRDLCSKTRARRAPEAEHTVFLGLMFTDRDTRIEQSTLANLELWRDKANFGSMNAAQLAMGIADPYDELMKEVRDCFSTACPGIAVDAETMDRITVHPDQLDIVPTALVQPDAAGHIRGHRPKSERGAAANFDIAYAEAGEVGVWVLAEGDERRRTTSLFLDVPVTVRE